MLTFYKEERFKETPIGKIPEDWEIIRVHDFINVLKGYPFSSKFFNSKGKGLSLIRIRDLGKEVTESYYNGPYDKTYIIREGDILVSMDGEFNIYIWRGPEGLLNQRICKIWSKDRKKIDDLFLYYILKKPLKLVEAQISQTTVKHLLDRDIRRIRIPCPSLEEQKAIAQILSTVDEAIQKTDEIIEKTERLKKGLMQELLTRGIGHKEFKDTEIGRIPKKWRICKLGSILKLKNGERPKISDNGEIPIYGANGVMGHTTDFLVDNDFTIIIGRVGASGEIHMGRGKIWVSDNAIYSESYKKEEIHLPFLYYLLKLKNLSHFATKTTHPIITQTFLNSFPIQLPPPQEQKTIVYILSTVDKRLEIEREKKEKLERIKKALMDLLLTGKIRVKVS